MNHFLNATIVALALLASTASADTLIYQLEGQLGPGTDLGTAFITFTAIIDSDAPPVHEGEDYAAYEGIPPISLTVEGSPALDGTYTADVGMWLEVFNSEDSADVLTIQHYQAFELPASEGWPYWLQFEFYDYTGTIFEDASIPRVNDRPGRF
jgi:hypothetical protein